MGSKRSGSQRASRQAITRREQKRARHPSLGSVPRPATPTSATPFVRPRTGEVVATAEPSAMLPELRTALAPMPEPAPPAEIVEPSDAAPATAHNIPDESGPDTQPLLHARVAHTYAGRQRYPTLARMASITLRRPPAAPQASPAEEPPLPSAATSTGSTAEAGPEASHPAPRHDHPARPADRPRRAAAGRPLPLPRAEVVLVVASAHAALAVVATLLGAALLLAGYQLWFWALILAGVAGVGGWVAYAATQTARERALASAALVCSQAGLLGWALAFVGPRVALLLFVPGAAILAQRTSGRRAATSLVVLALAAYATDVVLSLTFGLAPAVALDPVPSAILDGALAAIGLLLALFGALDATAGRAKAELVARARQGEVRRLRARIDRLRRQSEDDAAALYRALDSALEGAPPDVAGVDGVLSPVAARIADIGEHVADLRDELGERDKLEAALAQLALVLERAWLGLAWSWPAPTGTPVDDVVSLLRTPNPRHLAPLLADDQPTAPIPVPTDPEMGARRRVIPSPRSNPDLTSSARHTNPRHDVAHALAHPEPRPAVSHTSPLRWQEWDDWRRWQGDRVE